MSVEVRVPTLGESVTEATVATWFKKPGETVSIDEMLCELETDKVTVEVPSPAAGKLGEIVAAEGETVGVDALLATIAEEGVAGPEETRPKRSPEKTEAARERPAPVDAKADKAEAKPQKTEAKPGKPAKPDEGEGGTKVDVKVPALGESVTEATVSTWFKKVGDKVAQDEMLCELETDKVSVEVPAPQAGTLAEIVAPEGTSVEPQGLLAVIAAGTGAAASAQADYEAPPPPGQPETAVDEKSRPPREAEAARDVEDAPSAKKLMAEKGVDRGAVEATGRDGRVMKEDVLKALSQPAKEAEAPKPAPRAPVAAEDAGREERVRMTRLRQTIARRLQDAQNTAAMLTTYNEVDMSGVMGLRSEYKDLFEKKHGVKLGFMSFFTKACVHALREVPEVNAEIDGTDVVYKHFVHMGIAVGTPTGLVVPVVRDADRMGFAEIEKAINALGVKARDGKLSMAEMQGGTFTLSNGGVYGSLMSSPILNPPQSGILGMHKIEDRPVVVKGQIVIRPMMYLALSYDHRIVDGKGAVTFLVRVKEALEDPRRLLMDL